MKLLPYGRLMLRTHFSPEKVEKIIKEHIRDLDMEQAFNAQRAGIFMGQISNNSFAIGPWFCWRLCGQTLFEGKVQTDAQGTYLDIVTRGSYLQCGLYYVAIIGVSIYNYCTSSLLATLVQLAIFLVIHGIFVHCFWEDVKNFQVYLCEILEAREPEKASGTNTI